MTSLLNLHVLRSIADALADDSSKPVAGIINSYAGPVDAARRIGEMAIDGLLDLSISKYGRAQLEAEPKVARDKPMLTNR